MAKKGFIKDLNDVEILPITRGELVIDSSGKEAFHSNEFLATTSLPGLMSAEDKNKLDNLEGSLQYDIVSTTADGLAPKINTTASAITTQTDEWVLTTTKRATPSWRKLPVNAFLNRPISVNGTSILENNNTALNLVAGNNITLVPEKDTGKVTIHSNITNITGNAATADKLKNKVKLWGLEFDGSSDVSGNLTGVGNITAASSIGIISSRDGNIELKFNNENINSIVLQNGVFKPFVAANGLINLGNTKSRWNGIYGQSLDVTGNITSGSIYATGSIRTYHNISESGYEYGVLLNDGAIELSSATPFIDFHYNKSTKDYTSRIIEGLEGQLTVTGKLRVGLSYTTSTDYKFHVEGTTYSSGNITSGNTIIGKALLLSRADRYSEMSAYGANGGVDFYFGVTEDEYWRIDVCNNSGTYIARIAELDKNNYLNLKKVNVGGGFGTERKAEYTLGVYGTLGVTGAATFAKTVTSSVATGTAPFNVSSKTLVSNLNADMLDGQHASRFIGLYTRADIGTAPNYDNPSVNGLFEIRPESALPDATGERPFNGNAPFFSIKAENVMMQIAGTSYFKAGWWIRGKQSANVTLEGTPWERLVTEDALVREWDISVKGNAATATTDIGNGVFIMYHRLSDNYPLAVTVDKWTAAQNKGETADGVLIVDGDRKLVVATTDAVLYWNSASVSAGGKTTEDRQAALNDFEGLSNTMTQITHEECIGTNYASGYCAAYSTANANGYGLGVGKWWLPSLGELMMIRANMRKINYALSLIEGATQLGETWYWSSTEFSATKAWYLRLTNGSAGSYAKATYQFRVRAVSAFYRSTDTPTPRMPWSTILESPKLSDFTSALTGVGSATKLKTARKLWGNDFDGSSDINETIYVDNIRSIKDKHNLILYDSASTQFGGVYDGEITKLAGSNICFISGSYSANTTKMIITDNGNVGIGTTSPEYKLDVNGNTRIIGTSTFADGIYARKSINVLNSLSHPLIISRINNNKEITKIYQDDNGLVFDVTNDEKTSRVYWNFTATDVENSDGTDAKSGTLHFGINSSSKTYVAANEIYGNLDGTYVNKLTGYTKATTAADLVETDTLNIVLGKLEYKADIAYSWYRSITLDDTDEIINKWDEVVDFVNGLEVDLTDEFVTRKTDLVITGIKTFKSGYSGEKIKLENGNIISSLNTKGSWDRALSFSNTSGDTSVGAYFGVRGTGIKIYYAYIAHQNLDCDSATFKVYANRATILSNEIYHKGNLKNLSDLNDDVVSGKYLPLSGGTLAGKLTINTSGYADQLEIYRNQADGNSLIRFSNSERILGHIGVCGSGSTYPYQPCFVNELNTYQIYHSGNLTKLSQLTNDSGFITSSGSITGSSKILRFQNSIVSSTINIWNSYYGTLQIHAVAPGKDVPTNYTYGYLHNYRWDSGQWSNQLYFSVSDYESRLFTRGYRDDTDTWTPWNTVAFLSDIDSKLSGYLPLTGGTMTGPITLTSGGLFANDKTALSFISTTGTELARIGTDINNHLGLYSKGTIYIRPNHAFTTSNIKGIILSSTQFTYNTYNVLHEGNYTSYTVKKDGTGATGIWNIGLTGKNITSEEELDALINKPFLVAYIENSVVEGFSDGIILSTGVNNRWGHLIYLDDNREIFRRRSKNGEGSAWYPWRDILDSGNYTSYTIKKDGTGATGTWGINITGSAESSLRCYPLDSLYKYNDGYTVEFVKEEIVKLLAKQSVGVGYNIIVPATVINNWNNPSYITSPSSTYSLIKIGGSYSGTTHGLWLLSSYADKRLGYVGRNHDVWSSIKWLATTEDIDSLRNYYWADIKISSSANTDTSPTFAYPTSKYLKFTNGTEAIGYVGRGSSNNNLYFANYKNSDVSIYTDNNETHCIYLKTGGNVGIGTTNPDYKLEVNGTTATSKLTIKTSIQDHASPNSQCLVLYSSPVPSDSSLTLKNAPGIGFHVLSFTWGSLVFNGNFHFLADDHANYKLVYAKGFVKQNSSDSYVLLGGGGHKAISDFLLKSELANLELSNNLTTITKELTVTQDWMDTGIAYNSLPANGSYIVLVYVQANDGKGEMYSCYWSGVMTWFVTNPNTKTNDTETDEIILHRSGHAYHNTIYLRTVMTTGSSSSLGLKLLIAANKNLGAAYTYTFKFKRII